jgi:hypothetical protein
MNKRISEEKPLERRGGKSSKHSALASAGA